MDAFRQEHDRLIVYLSGEIDHSISQNLRIQIENMILKTNASHLSLDFSKVSFMDSSGIGMIIGRYKTMAARNGSMSACGMEPAVRRLFCMAGLHRIIAIEEERKEKDA